MEINRIDIKEQLRDARRQVESEYEQFVAQEQHARRAGSTKVTW